MSNTIVIGGIVVGVVAMVGIMVYAHDNQQNYLSEDAMLAPAAEQGSFTSELGMVELNKEEWHEDPYADLAQKIREQNGR
ncbi:MAG: hypothetical protein ACRBB2_07020 [Nitrosopumilus sp.]